MSVPLADDLYLDAEVMQTDYQNMRTFLTAIREFPAYIAANSVGLINYGERYRSGERISSAFVGATVNAAVSKRFAKKQQIQWSKHGALIFSSKPARERSTDHSDRHSRSGIQQWPTTITSRIKRSLLPERPQSYWRRSVAILC